VGEKVKRKHKKCEKNNNKEYAVARENEIDKIKDVKENTYK